MDASERMIPSNCASNALPVGTLRGNHTRTVFPAIMMQVVCDDDYRIRCYSERYTGATKLFGTVCFKYWKVPS